jgi:hypothetical protein
MTEVRSTRFVRGTRRSDPRTMARFMEELSWLLDSYDGLDFKALSVLANQLVSASSAKSRGRPRSDDNFIFLGRLPSLFMDEELFAGNEDIVEFAKYALDIDIPRWHKKSKYELIGHVVCNANLLDNNKLKQLSSAIERLQDSKSPARSELYHQRKLGLSWNEVIQNMLEVS